MSEALSIPLDEPPSAAQPKVRHREYCRKLLAQGTLTRRDQDYLVELLHRHPHADRKIGPGIRRIGIWNVPPWGKRGFYIERIDGTRTDFSYPKCLAPPNARQAVIAAMRQAIGEQIIEFKKQAFAGVCEVSGEPLAWHDAHVDHADPVFADIAEDFAALYGGYENIKLLPSQDGLIGRPLHSDVAAHFQTYHRDRVRRLQIVSPKTNWELYLARRNGA